MMLSDELIHKAFSEGWYTCHYQPQIDRHHEKVVGVEALFRLDIPKVGIVMPAEFIERAVELGYESTIFFAVLTQSVNELSQLNHEVLLSINITEGVISDSTHVESVASLLKDSDFPAKRITLELSENDAFTPALNKQLKAYKAIGATISMDDFGAGYSNMKKLIQLDIDELKFDKSVVANQDIEKQSLLESIIRYCKSLGIKTVAEGIETREIKERVRNLGVDCYQGFYFSRPINFESLRLSIA